MMGIALLRPTVAFLLGMVCATIFYSVPALSSQSVRAAIASIAAAYARNDRAAIADHFAPDHLVVTTYTGVMPVDEYLSNAIDDIQISSAAVREHKLVQLGDGVFMRTYYVENAGTYRGARLPERVLATQIWTETDGNWRQRLYQETPLDPD